MLKKPVVNSRPDSARSNKFINAANRTYLGYAEISCQIFHQQIQLQRLEVGSPNAET